MPTPPELIEATRQRVESILRDAFPEYVPFSNGSFSVSYGSTQVIIVVRPFTETECVVECIAHVVSGAKISEELLRYLLRKNAEIHLGGFGLLFDDTIIFSHSITATNMDRNELVTTITSVAIIADHYDDEIVAMAGGQRAADVRAE
ncbi:MAG: hypothetical protein KatS3mg039_0550 [Candidatus Kapaibacterium sp.]|nr:MAG: hypothetical protein KatS3mg039_0550 [Candidatus Kapabacteria bacterium]